MQAIAAGIILIGASPRGDGLKRHGLSCPSKCRFVNHIDHCFDPSGASSYAILDENNGKPLY